MANGIALPVRAHHVENFNTSPNCQRTFVILVRPVGQVVTVSPFSRSDHSCYVGFNPPSLLLSRPDGQGHRCSITSGKSICKRLCRSSDFCALSQQTEPRGLSALAAQSSRSTHFRTATLYYR